MHTASADGERTIILTLVQGEDLVQGIERLVMERRIEKAHFVGEGALAYAVLSAFDWRQEREYGEPVDGRLELLRLNGETRLDCDGECRVDAHASLAAPNGRQLTGRLLEGYVYGQLTVYLTDARVLPEAARRAAVAGHPGARL